MQQLQALIFQFGRLDFQFGGLKFQVQELEVGAFRLGLMVLDCWCEVRGVGECREGCERCGYVGAEGLEWEGEMQLYIYVLLVEKNRSILQR